MQNGDNIIDSREVIERHEELKSEFDDLAQTLMDSYEDWESDKDQDKLEVLKVNIVALQEWEEYDEYKELCALIEEVEDYGDWKHGEAMILDSHFTDYARELAEDIGATSKDVSWSNDCIDWDQAADNLKADYTSVSFGSNEYWIRS